MNQKEAVFQAIVNITGHSEGKCTLSTEHRTQVRMVILEGFKNDLIELDRAPYDTDSEWSGYISGLVSNWLRKDKRLNGGDKYVPKNPGSRSGVSSDPQLKELMKCYQVADTEELKNEVMEYINLRKAELTKAKAPTINVDALPEAIRSKFFIAK